MIDEYEVRREPGAPDWRAVAIAPAVYRSPVVLERELEQVFARTWLLAGRMDQLRAPGDYFTFEIGNDSVLVVHAGEAGIQAFANVCLHRGRRLVPAGECGTVTRFKCPYHNWTYALDGRLRGVPDAEAFPALDKDALRLHPVRAEVWQGLVFVSFDPGVEPLRDYLGVLPDCLDGAFEPGVLVAAQRHDFAANWKTVLEAFIETYHIGGLHPQVAKSLLWKEAAIAHFPRHAMTVVPAAKANRWRERRRQSWCEWIADRQYLEYHYTIFPNLSVHVFIQGVTFLFRCLPDVRDPERMRMDVWIWKRLREGETPPAHLAMQDAHIEILEQDYANFELVQAGNRARVFTGPRLNYFESRIGHFHGVLQAYLDPQ